MVSTGTQTQTQNHVFEPTVMSGMCAVMLFIKEHKPLLIGKTFGTETVFLFLHLSSNSRRLFFFLSE